MTAQPTPEQRAEWDERVNLLVAFAGQPAKYGTLRSTLIDAIFDAGHAAALEGAVLEVCVDYPGTTALRRGPGPGVEMERTVLPWKPAQP